MSDLASRLAGALAPVADGVARVPPLVGDHIDLPDHDRMAAAAVLIAVTDRERPGVLLTQRTETLRRHAGQVAFPGGRLDPGEDAVTAALREADEEIALPRSAVAIVGMSERYRTGTGFSVTPIVGVVPPDLPLHPSEAEVASVFEVPLDFLLDPANRRRATTLWQGRERSYYELLWHDRRIWGATAGMIVNLAAQLNGWRP